MCSSTIVSNKPTRLSRRDVSTQYSSNGLLVGVFAVGLGQTLPKTTASRLASTLLLLAGLAMLGLAFTTDATTQANRATWHGIIHDLSFAGLEFTLFPSMLAFGWAFRRSSGWRGLSMY